MTITTKEIFKKIRQIEISTKKLVEELLAGAWRSAFKGNGMEFEEVREYTPGDDVRKIDWNVSARMNRPFVKIFQEERELTTLLLVDISASSRYGSKNRLKSELIAEIGAALAFSAIKNQDKVGLLLFSDEVELYIPPQKGKRHVLRVIRELLIHKPRSKKTNIAEALRVLGNLRRRSALCFIISDYICPSNYQQELKVNAKNHDIVLLSVQDPLETTFPSFPILDVKDLETDEEAVVGTGSFEFQTEFTKAMLQKKEDLKKLAAQIGVDFVTFQTDQPYGETIRRFFKMRRQKG